MTKLRLYNTVSRSVEEFKPQDSGRASIYTCGPTVYDRLTIGNWASFVRWDVLVRTLKLDYDVEWYMNITDVGHLVSDGDEGEDKLEKGARREGKSAWQVAAYYTNDFLQGLKMLNIDIPKENLVKATDHIKEQIDLIKILENKGYTYVISDGVYFDSTKFKDYGKMAKIDISGLAPGARVQLGDKKNSTDFALWKFSPPGHQRDMEWSSPWGKGFPGWHVECSAMAMRYLGATLDIHAGGIDHIPVHHTNEIAQSEAATGQTFAYFWLHSNFLQVEGQKISKSLGNGYTLQDLQKKAYDALDFRLFILQSHFQTESNFTWEGMKSASTRLDDIRAMADLRFQLHDKGKDMGSELKLFSSSIEQALKDNLNTPQALALISEFINRLEGGTLHSSNREAFINYINLIDSLLGLELTNSEDITKSAKKLLEQRNQARIDRQWSLSDKLRRDLEELGLQVIDSPQGQLWRQK